jgi:hypothetical protein
LGVHARPDDAEHVAAGEDIPAVDESNVDACKQLRNASLYLHPIDDLVVELATLAIVGAEYLGSVTEFLWIDIALIWL